MANATGTKTTETSYYPGPGGTHAMRIDGTVKYLFRDRLDTVVATWDPATDNVTRHGYHPYGTRRINTAASGTAHGYTGQRHDPTGLSYYHARYYDPYTGRFTGPDTIIPDPANPQSLNRYAYVNGNPIRFNDPTGHCGEGDPRVGIGFGEPALCPGANTADGVYRDLWRRRAAILEAGGEILEPRGIHAREWCGSATCPSVGPDHTSSTTTIRRSGTCSS